MLSYSVVISAYNIRATFIREEPFEKNKITNVLVAATEKKVVWSFIFQLPRFKFGIIVADTEVVHDPVGFLSTG